MNDGKGITPESSGPLRAPEPQGYVPETRREMAGSDQNFSSRLLNRQRHASSCEGVVTKQAIRKLIALLELRVDAFPTSRTATA